MWKNMVFFPHVFDIANQLLTCHSSFTPLGQVMNEQQNLHHSQSKIVCWNIFWIMAAKTLKNPYCLKTVTFKLS